MVEIPKLNIEPYLDAARRRKWWILVPLVIAVIAGAVYAKTTPRVYRATTLILVEPQRIPTSYVTPTVTQSVAGRLRTISQQVHSRTNLERIIEEFNLYPEAKVNEQGLRRRIEAKLRALLGRTGGAEGEPEVPMMARVEDLRNRIQVSIRSQGAEGTSAFEISFEWHDPQLAASVTNAVASQFIEQNLRVREEMAMGTTAFLEAETERLRGELEVREKTVESFKKEHMGMLPDQLESNLNILAQLKEELTNLEKRVDMEKQQALMLQSQMQNMALGPDPSLLMETEIPEAGGGELWELEKKLEDLRGQYTDRHPDVVVLKRRIEKLREEEAASGEAGDPAESLDLGFMGGEEMTAMQVEQINSRVQTYEDQILELKRQIDVYRERVEKTPQVELELNKLLRDYETVQQRYANLLSKRLDAQMAEELEKRQKGEQFRVIDPAIPPDRPFKPDMRKIMLMALMAGLAFGGGLAYLREVMDPRFHSPEEVEAYLRAKVIVSLPDLRDEGKASRFSRFRFSRKRAA
ncbi:MAG: GNVR domain-containing protein [Thermodesulfobacteriota bacterium]|nr:GNVR domain-containing protein [Thermodesulfobacteriota bacterium]